MELVDDAACIEPSRQAANVSKRFGYLRAFTAAIGPLARAVFGGLDCTARSPSCDSDRVGCVVRLTVAG